MYGCSDNHQYVQYLALGIVRSIVHVTRVYNYICQYIHIHVFCHRSRKTNNTSLQ